MTVRDKGGVIGMCSDGCYKVKRGGQWKCVKCEITAHETGEVA